MRARSTSAPHARSAPLPNQNPACRGLVNLKFAGSGQARSRIERDERDPLFAEIFFRALQPIDEGDDLRNARTALAHRAHHLHHRAAFGGDVVEHDDAAAGLEIAVDLSLGAVVFDLLALPKKPATAGAPAAGIIE